MRPGNRWDGKAASPLASALYGAAVSVVVAYGLSYLFERLGAGAITGAGTWHSRQSLMLTALNLYACQHVSLVGSGTLPEMGRVHATVNLPLTLWAVIPAFSLMLGGFIAARARSSAGRWSAIGAAIMSGLIYAAMLAAVAHIVSAKFLSAALPAVSAPGISTEFNPLDIPFSPSVIGALSYGSLFGVLFCYLGALCAVRDGRREPAPGKWWACAKAVLTVAIVMQLLVAIAGGAWLVLSSRYSALDAATRPKYIQIIPAATGIAYSLLFGAKLSYAATPATMPDAARSADISLYRGITTKEGNSVTRKPPWRYAWIGAVIGALMALASGRLAVKWGSTDGSLPTAIRITILQATYLAVLVPLCRMGWGVSGQFTVFAGACFDSTLFLSAVGVFVLALIGAHRANHQFSGSLSGFPAV